MLRPQDPNAFGAVISRIWTFIFFVMIFRDLHEMATAKTINEILNGTLEGNPVTNTGLVIGGMILVIMLLTSFFSTLLKPAIVRRLNLVVAPLALLGGMYLPPNDPDDYLLAAVTTLALLSIIVMCWFWKTDDGHVHEGEVRHVV